MTSDHLLEGAIHYSLLEFYRWRQGTLQNELLYSRLVFQFDGLVAPQHHMRCVEPTLSTHACKRREPLSNLWWQPWQNILKPIFNQESSKNWLGHTRFWKQDHWWNPQTPLACIWCKWVCHMYVMQAQGIIATYFGFSAVPRNCSNSCSINRNQETALFSATNTHLPSAHTSHFLLKKVKYKIDNNWVHVKLYEVGNQATGELQSLSHQAIGTSQAHFRIWASRLISIDLSLCSS